MPRVYANRPHAVQGLAPVTHTHHSSLTAHSVPDAVSQLKQSQSQALDQGREVQIQKEKLVPLKEKYSPLGRDAV